MKCMENILLICWPVMWICGDSRRYVACVEDCNAGASSRTNTGGCCSPAITSKQPELLSLGHMCFNNFCSKSA